MKTDDFDYYLPEELIAQTPIKNRDHSRLLVMNRKTGEIEHKVFADIIRKVHDRQIDTKDLQNAKDFFNKKAQMALNDLDDDNRNKIQSLLDGIEDSTNIVHGDYHPSNIMMQEEEPLLIDMDTLSYGNRVYDLLNTYVCLKGFGQVDRSMTEEFLNIPYEKCSGVTIYNI